MLILISPSKTLDLTNNTPDIVQTSTPRFTEESEQLIQILKEYSVEGIGELMSLSDKLSELNYQRFQNFLSNDPKASLYAYKGDVYEGFELSKYTPENLEFANEHLKIISGLYGILKPLDLIKPYRLEMSTSLKNPKGKNLYNFWGDKLTKYLEHENTNYIINLASKEYSSAININKLSNPLINITFKEHNQGKYKVIGIHSKKARGIMANFIIRNNITQPNDLKSFDLKNYKYIPEFSSENEYVFVR